MILWFRDREFGRWVDFVAVGCSSTLDGDVDTAATRGRLGV
jgi:hypothetical protein